uniref:Uncharacterized protein n=1 Tax=Phlebotomus papatasi TaxID=29031 RepID=A0A1B0GPM4_PHLPP
MLNDKADEVVLETEITNTPALRLYENLGFVRDKRLFHYYLSGVDALRLKLLAFLHLHRVFLSLLSRHLTFFFSLHLHKLTGHYLKRKGIELI